MATRNWTGLGGDNKATTAGNWDTPPITGDSVVVGFDSRGITWDIDPATVALVAVTFQGNAAASGNMTITLGHAETFTGALLIKSLHATNTVTLATSTYTLTCGALTLDTLGCLSQTGTGGNVTCTSYTQSGVGSVLTGKVDATFTVSGNITITNGSGWDSFTVNGVFNGNTVVTSNAGFYLAGMATTVGSKLTLPVNQVSYGGGSSFENRGEVVITQTLVSPGFASWVNTGICSGSGTIQFEIRDADRIINFGNISTAIVISQNVSVLAPHKITLSGPMIGKGIAVTSLHVTFVATLDLAGFPINASGLVTASTRGIISSSVPGATLQANGITVAATGTIDATNISQITNSGNLDTSAGTFTPGTSLYVQSSMSATINLAAGGTIYNFIAKSSVITLLANATISKLFAHSNLVIKGAYTLTLTDPTKEYTGMRRPIRLPLKKLDIGQVCAQCGWMRNLGALL